MFVFALLMVGLYSLVHEEKTVPVMLAAFSILLAFVLMDRAREP